MNLSTITTLTKDQVACAIELKGSGVSNLEISKALGCRITLINSAIQRAELLGFDAWDKEKVSEAKRRGFRHAPR